MGENVSAPLSLPMHLQVVCVHSSKGHLYKAGIKELNHGTVVLFYEIVKSTNFNF